MTPRQVALVRQSWMQLQPVADEAARMFYVRLFEIDPALKPLFRSDIAEQGRKLMGMLAVAIHALERIDSLAGLQDLGARHARYGVKPEHYPRVGEALLWALEQGLGGAFTVEVKDAWGAAYARLARRMQAAQASG
jgi:hemoglobin-like flavoprotein